MRRLKQQLEWLYAQYDCVESAADPVHIVRRYRSPADREIVGFLASALAFGRVASVLASIERLLAVIGPSPAEFVRAFDAGRSDACRTLGHRWVRGEDLRDLFVVLRRMLETAGSIEGFFVAGLTPNAADVSEGLESFSRRAVALAPASRRTHNGPGVRFFFARPSSGGACKRLNLFLRWMVRRDAIDLGVWRRVSPALLIVPLDTHVIRVGQCLGLTSRRSPGWAMAADITAGLRALDPHDPVRYDFALCHLGMKNACAFNRRQTNVGCPLRGICRPDGDRDRASRRPSAPR